MKGLTKRLAAAVLLLATSISTRSASLQVVKP
jgi:hypothetical protein